MPWETVITCPPLSVLAVAEKLSSLMNHAHKHSLPWIYRVEDNFAKSFPGSCFPTLNSSPGWLDVIKFIVVKVERFKRYACLKAVMGVGKQPNNNIHSEVASKTK